MRGPISDTSPPQSASAARAETTRAAAKPEQSTQASGLIALQRLAGNRAVGLMLQRQAAAGPLGYDPATLEQEGKLPGAGSPVQAVQRQGGPAAIKSVSSTTVFHDPNIIRRPGAQIAASHGRAGAVGWTTPRFNIQFPRVTATDIEVTTTIDWDMELDSAYSGGRLSVLQEHEQGHVRIGQEKARANFGDALSNALSALPDFTAANRAGIVAARNAAATGFQTDEGTASRDYDTADYPRMVLAYYGVRTPLATLAAGSAGIGKLVRAIGTFISLSGGKVSSTTALTRANAVIDARSALSDDDLARLQYNSGFQALVARCAAVANEVRGRAELDETARDRAWALAAVLGDFRWSADEVLRTVGAI